ALITLLCAGLVLFSLFFLSLGLAPYWYWYLLIGFLWLAVLGLMNLPDSGSAVIDNVDSRLERRFLMDSLGEHSPVIYVAVDHDGIIIEAAGSALADAGMRPAKIIGKSIISLIK